MKGLSFTINAIFFILNIMFLIQCFIQEYLSKNHILASLVFGGFLLVNIIALLQDEKDS